MTATRLAFGDYGFEPRSGALTGPVGTKILRPQAARALAVLAGSAGELVSRDRLRRELWPDKRVVLFEVSISTVIRELRRALGDDSRRPRFIETIPRRGYRFVAPVSVSHDSHGPAAGPLATRPRRTGVVGHLARAAGFLALLTIVPLLGGTASIPVSRSSDAGGGSVAVLELRGFRASGETPAAAAQAAALDDELATALAAARLPGFRVIAGETAPESFHDFAFEGSVRSDDEGWLVTARVSSARRGELVWSQRYRRRDDLSPLATREIAVRIAQGVLEKVAPRPTGSSNREVLAATSKGRRLLTLNTSEATQGAIEALERAVSLDSDDSEAQAALAEALLKWPGVGKTAEVVERARAAATRAVAADPTQAGAQRALGEIALYFDWNWEEARLRLQRAVSLAPADAGIRDAWAAWLSARGRNEEALAEIRLARALDPSSVAISIDVMLFHYFARDYPGTLEAAARLAKLWPGNYASDYYSMFALLSSGDRQRAVDYATDALVRWDRRRADAGQSRLAGGEPINRLWERWLAGMLGSQNQAAVDGIAPALAYLQLGKRSEALDRIETATREHYFSYLMPYLGVTPALDGLRGDPRFEYLLRGLGEAALTDYYDSAPVARSESQ